MASSVRIEELKKKFDENPRRYFAPLANEHRKTGDLDQAISLCRAHLPQQPGHISGHIVLAQALFEARDLDESRNVFQSALDLDPENLIALRYLGDIARNAGDISTARSWYDRVLEVDPRNDEIATLLRELDTAPAAVPVAEEMRTAAPALTESSLELAETPAVPAGNEGLQEDSGAHEWAPPVPLPTPAFGSISVDPNAPTPARGSPAIGEVHASEPSFDALFDGPMTTEPFSTALPTHQDFTVPGSSLDDDAFGSAGLDDVDLSEFEGAHGLAPSDDFGDLEAAGDPDVEAWRNPLEDETSAARAAAPTEATPEEAALANAFEEIALADAAPPPRQPTPAGFFDSVSSASDVLQHADAESLGAPEPTSAQPESEGAAGILHDEPFHLDIDHAPENAAGEETPRDEAAKPDEAQHDAFAWDEHALEDVETAPAPSAISADVADDQTVPPHTASEPIYGFATAASTSDATVSEELGLEPMEFQAPARPAPPAMPNELHIEAPTEAATPAAFVTETMAELYLQQGFRDEALSVYRQLLAQNPSDGSLRQRVEQLESGSSSSISMEALAEDVESLSHRRASPSERSVRSFFASLAGRRVPMAARKPVNGGDAASDDYSRGQYGGSAARAAIETETPAPTLDRLFGEAPVNGSDDAAAAALASAYGGVEPPGRPTRAATSELSLDRVFRETPEPTPASPDPGGFSFDQFFSEPSRSEEDRAATPAVPQTATPAGRSDDIEQFTAWLEGLKRK